MAAGTHYPLASEMSKDIGHLDGRHRARGYCFCGGAASGHKKLIKERAKVVFQDSDDGFDAGHQLRIMGRLGEVVVFSQENGIKVAIACHRFNLSKTGRSRFLSCRWVKAHPCRKDKFTNPIFE